MKPSLSLLGIYAGVFGQLSSKHEVNVCPHVASWEFRTGLGLQKE